MLMLMLFVTVCATTAGAISSNDEIIVIEARRTVCGSRIFLGGMSNMCNPQTGALYCLENGVLASLENTSGTADDW